MPITIIRQDITKVRCDAIVNPTNSDLIPGGGTDAAIHAAAGGRLAKACGKLGGCELGQAVITPAFALPCKYVIHTVGPVWMDGSLGERALLESCYIKSLQLAKEHQCRSVAFPLISSGAYGYPKDQVLKIAMNSIGTFLRENEMAVTIVVYDKTSFRLSRELMEDVTAFIDDRYTEEGGLSRTMSNGIGRRLRPHPSETLMCGDACVDCSDVPAAPLAAPLAAVSAPLEKRSTLEERLREMDKGFAETLFYYIDAKGMDDVECYKKANIDRKTFSKIKCSKNYKPSKQTVLSFAISLKLTIEETNHLLNTVGMSLSRSSKFDVIVAYFIENGKYDIYEINETLFAFDQMLLGA